LVLLQVPVLVLPLFPVLAQLLVPLHVQAAIPFLAWAVFPAPALLQLHRLIQLLTGRYVLRFQWFRPPSLRLTELEKFRAPQVLDVLLFHELLSAPARSRKSVQSHAQLQVLAYANQLLLLPESLHHAIHGYIYFLFLLSSFVWVQGVTYYSRKPMKLNG